MSEDELQKRIEILEKQLIPPSESVTTIQITHGLKQHLNNLKVNRKDTFQKVIGRLLEERRGHELTGSTTSRLD